MEGVRFPHPKVSVDACRAPECACPATGFDRERLERLPAGSRWRARSCPDRVGATPCVARGPRPFPVVTRHNRRSGFPYRRTPRSSWARIATRTDTATIPRPASRIDGTHRATHGVAPTRGLIISRVAPRFGGGPSVSMAHRATPPRHDASLPCPTRRMILFGIWHEPAV